MKKGFVCGVFDLFHLGHVLMLKECKENCDYLLVALNTAEHINPQINPNKMAPLFTIQERVEIMKACKFVDEVITYSSENELLEIMKNNNLNIRFLGDDYKGKPITGADLEIPIHYCDRSHGLSTSKYKRKLVDSLK
ncbi:adenylyltransferase/cytidyltransferase family protein [Crocinitomix algicola]|uniref:adenylyltransferase/cytidyltransferase family protein n=1 Tax=Crocinitomix algicola TaxID=1740263 RepID=UPI000832D522|nr:adenylyltransferase/cytidyltransferase family protein [Crocinitomix algicola]